jgi:hypothetical protein
MFFLIFLTIASNKFLKRMLKLRQMCNLQVVNDLLNRTIRSISKLARISIEGISWPTKTTIDCRQSSTKINHFVISQQVIIVLLFDIIIVKSNL